MFQKICNYLSILSTVLVLGIIGGGFFTYKYVTSEQFKAKIMNQVLENVQDLMPNILDNALPDTTGKIMPISNTMSDDTKQFLDYIEKRNKEYIEWETKGKWENL